MSISEFREAESGVGAGMPDSAFGGEIGGAAGAAAGFSAGCFRLSGGSAVVPVGLGEIEAAQHIGESFFDFPCIVTDIFE